MRKNKKQTSALRRSPGNMQKDAKVFSYYSNRSSSDSNVGRLKQKVRKGVHWQLIPSFIAVFVILASLVYISSLATQPRLKIKQSSGVTLLQDEVVYQDAAEKLLQGSVFNRSKLLINTKHLEAQMREQFPELKTVGITVPLSARHPIVTVEAVEPRLMLVSDKGSFLIDGRGRTVLSTADQGVAAKYNIPIVIDQTGLELKLGEIVLSSRDTAFASELHHQLKEKAIEVESLTLPPLINELHMKPKNKNYFVKFNMLGDPRLQAGTLLATMERLDQDRQRPTEYIDVRVEEKAFFK